MKSLTTIFAFFILISASAQIQKDHNLHFDSLAKNWDEAIPLGNGWLGALIWQKNDKVRISLDRIDLWDDRPMPEIDKLKFKWVVQQVKKGEYDTVQKLGDHPYENYPAPTKIPGAALEFDLKRLGKVVSNDLDITNGLSLIRFESGTIFLNYIHATNQVGYFGFENLPSIDMIPELIIPAYNTGSAGTSGNSVEGQGLQRLGYKKGTIKKGKDFIHYHQPTWQNNYYEVMIRWQKSGKKWIGQWTITSNKPATLPILNLALKEPTGWPTHIAWWKDYWSRSSVSLPDEQLEKQYYLEMYKFACVTRPNTPPISLQAIWTADNGNLPPWKGDYHHDLNTQLSYWPGYSGNHLDLTASFTNWLWTVKKENERWTKHYFELGILNVPGVTTISGKPMGGWIQYSMSPTTGVWLAQHFYWQGIYSMDTNFIKSRAWKYLIDVYTYIVSYLRESEWDSSFAPLGSSPEYHDNSITAWFSEFTNYDKGLVLSLKPYIRALDEIIVPNHMRFDTWDNIDSLKYSINETGLTIAQGQNLDESHRHHAHLMAIHPMGLLNPDDPKEKEIIDKSLRWLEKIGTRKWTGYSFTWAACIYARAKEGENAVKHLQIFASNFCSPNSFHLNGDQKGGQYSDFTYRPFTLEGNFAFAQGIHELLLQSHNGYIEVFPAIPKTWKDISFKTLRAEGAFLVSANKENGVIESVTIKAEKGGELRLKKPFPTWIIEDSGYKNYKVRPAVKRPVKKSPVTDENGIITLIMKKNQTIKIKNGYE